MPDGLTKLKEKYGVDVDFARDGDLVKIIITGSIEKLTPVVLELLKSGYPMLGLLLK